MNKSNFDLFAWLTGYSGWMFYCALISGFGLTGYYSHWLRGLVPDWVGVGLMLGPLIIIIFVQWGEAPSRVVKIMHLIAASWFLLLAIGMEVGIYRGYKPEGSELYRTLAHLGWTFAWAGILRRATKRQPS